MLLLLNYQNFHGIIIKVVCSNLDFFIKGLVTIKPNDDDLMS